MEGEFKPVTNRLYLFEKYSLLYLQSGQGLFQVDFKDYYCHANMAIFLMPGQYFQLLSGSFFISIAVFTEESIRHVKKSRYLFKHIVSVGHIDFNEAGLFPLLQQFPGSEKKYSSREVLNQAINDWLTINPFCTSEPELELLFNLKDIIDDNYREPVNGSSVAKALQEKPHRLQQLTREKLHHTLHRLANEKLLLEIKRKIVFTNLSAREIAYENGFKDPAYLNRFFKQKTNLTPLEFREQFSYESRNTFFNDLLLLIDAHYKEQHQAGFYAARLGMSVKTLGRNLKQFTNRPVKQLIHERILQEARIMLHQQLPVKEIAFGLGFREPNHFTAFFRHQTGKTPLQFKQAF